MIPSITLVVTVNVFSVIANVVNIILSSRRVRRAEAELAQAQILIDSLRHLLTVAGVQTVITPTDHGFNIQATQHDHGVRLPRRDRH